MTALIDDGDFDNAFRDDVRKFLERFFAPPNQFLWSERATSRFSHVLPWVERLSGATPEGTVLPCWRGEEVVWYVVAFSSEQESALNALIEAFVGPTYAQWRGRGEVLDVRDQIDAALARLPGGRGSKLCTRRGRPAQREVRLQLERMRAVLDRRPNRELQHPLPTGWVLRAFHMAVERGNLSVAQGHIDYLVANRRIEGINALFLRIQALAGAGDWPVLLALPALDDVVAMRRPVAVTEAILRALYEVFLAPLRAQGEGPEAARAVFESQIQSRFGSLLTRRAGIRSSGALAVLLLHAVVQEPVNSVARDALLATPDLHSTDRAYLRFLAGVGGGEGALAVSQHHFPSDQDVPPSDAELLELARDAQRYGDFERVLSLMREAPSSAPRARLLLETAYELRALDAKRAAQDAVAGLSAEERTRLLGSRVLRLLVEWLAGGDVTALEEQQSSSDFAQERPVGVSNEADAPACQAGEGRDTPEAGQPEAWAAAFSEPMPTDWLGWCVLATRDQQWSHAQALAVARQGAAEWDIEAFLALPGNIDRLADALSHAQSSDTVLCAVPHLLSYLRRDAAWPRREAAPVYQVMLLLVALGSRGAVDDLDAALDMLDVLLQFGPSPEEYDELIEAIRTLLLSPYASPHYVGWALDVANLLLAHGLRRSDDGVSVLALVVALAQKHRTRVEPAHWAVLRALSEEVGAQELLTRVTPAEEIALAGQPREQESAEELVRAVLARLDGRTIGLYSLTESAIRRARDLILRWAPNAEVYLCSDHVGSDRLRDVARNADVYVVVTGSATHAATNFIEAHRPKNSTSHVTLRLKGRGTASIIHALVEHLNALDQQRAA